MLLCCRNSFSPSRLLKYAISTCLLLLSTVHLACQVAADPSKSLDGIDSAKPGALVYRDLQETKAAISACANAGLRTEFDTVSSVMDRIAKAPCTFAGVTTFHGRGDSLLGDPLKYDAEHQLAFWDSPVYEGMRFGQIASPYQQLSAGGENSSSFQATSVRN